MKPISREPSRAASNGDIPFSTITGDVFHHHNGIVDHEAGGDGQGHQGEIIDIEAGQVHDAEGAHQRQGHGDAGDGRGPNAAQKGEDDQDYEEHGDDQGDFDIVDGSADGGGAVHADAEVNGRRNGGLQPRHDGHDAVHRVNNIGLRLAADDQQYGGLAVDGTGVAHILLRIDDRGDIGEAHGRALAIGNDQRSILLSEKKLIVVVEDAHVQAIGESALGLIGVGAGEGLADVFQADAQVAQQERIDLGADGGERGAADRDLSHAGDLRNFLGQDGIGDVVHLRLGGRVRGQSQDEDGRIGGIDLMPGGVGGQIGGQLSASGVDGGLHIARGAIDIAVDVENQDDEGRAQLAHGGHLGDAGDAGEHAFQRSGHGGGHGLGACSGQLGGHKNDGIDHVRQGRDGEQTVSQRSGKEQGNRQQRGGYRPANEWCGDIHELWLGCKQPNTATRRRRGDFAIHKNSTMPANFLTQMRGPIGESNLGGEATREEK